MRHGRQNSNEQSIQRIFKSQWLIFGPLWKTEVWCWTLSWYPCCCGKILWQSDSKEKWFVPVHSSRHSSPWSGKLRQREPETGVTSYQIQNPDVLLLAQNTLKYSDMLAKNHVLAGATHQMAHPYTKRSPGEQFYEPSLMLSRPFDGTAALNLPYLGPSSWRFYDLWISSL